MTDQEKLTDLIREAHKQCKAQNDCHVCEVYGNGSDCVYMLIANHLIANGVEIYNAEDEEALKMARQQTMEAHGDLRYLQGVQFGVESATKHGRWITEYWKSGYIKRCNCSLCGASPKDAYKPDNYCPNCGAKMDK